MKNTASIHLVFTFLIATLFSTESMGAPRRFRNTAPKVNAGIDQSVIDSDKNGSQAILLQGSASDAEKNIISYRLSDNGTTLASGASVGIFSQSLVLTVGSHNILMEATDSLGLKGSDSVLISVTAPAPVVNTAPKVNAGADVSVEDSDNNGSQAVPLSGSATDAENNISSYQVLENGIVLASGTTSAIFMQSLNLSVGSHIIILEATDAGGLKGSDSLVINVTAPAVVVNPPPVTGGTLVANAGADLMKVVETAGEVDAITLTGSASGSIAKYTWKLNGVIIREGSDPAILTTRFFIIKGSNIVTLEVMDASGAMASDTALIHLKPMLEAGAMMTATMGGARIFVDRDRNGYEMIRMLGAINSTVPLDGHTYKYMYKGMVLSNSAELNPIIRLPLGQHLVSLQVMNPSGVQVAYAQAVTDVSATYDEDPLYPRIPANFNVADYLTPSWGHGPGWFNDQSAFRFHCKPSHLLYDDPVVYPGQPGKSHLHLFFGNNTANGNSTYQSLRQNGTSSCHGGPLNRSAYWMPAMMNVDSKVVLPDVVSVYYKTQPGAMRLPRGLRTVFGWNPAEPTVQGGNWVCVGTGQTARTIAELNCPATDAAGNNQISLQLSMGACWNGQLDSPDHRSHIAHGNYNGGWGNAECPATHPIELPHFSLQIFWTHKGFADYSTWKLSSDVIHNATTNTDVVYPGGTTAHADWFGAWDDSVMDKWMNGCINNFLSCSGGDLADDAQLKWTPGWTWTTVPNIIDPPVKPMP